MKDQAETAGDASRVSSATGDSGQEHVGSSALRYLAMALGFWKGETSRKAWVLTSGVIAILLGHFVFKFHPAILFGVCAGVRTTTAALGMIQEAAKSKVPALGYGMPYAIGNTLLTIFGMVIVLILAGGS